MKKIILILVFVMGIMGLSAMARADTPDWMNPDSPLALGLHPRLLFIPQSYRATHPDAVGMTVQEMRDKLISHPEYRTEFHAFINIIDNDADPKDAFGVMGAYDIPVENKTKMEATYDAVSLAFLYMIDPAVMSQAPYNFIFKHTKGEYGDRAIEHAVYIAEGAKACRSASNTAITKPDLWFDSYCTFNYGGGSAPNNGITNMSLSIIADWMNDKIPLESKQLIMDAFINLRQLRGEGFCLFASGKHFTICQNGAGIIGLYGDDLGTPYYKDQAEYLMVDVENNWIKSFKEMSDLLFEGGANNPEGPGYDPTAFKNMLSFINPLSTAIKENLFQTVSYLREHVYYDLYRIFPIKYEGSYYTIQTDDCQGLSTFMEWGKNQIFFSSMINGYSKYSTDQASITRWMKENFYLGPDGLETRCNSVFYKFFQGYKHVESKSLSKIGLPKSKNVGMGEYLMRTGFEDTSDSIVAFFAPKYHILDGGHAHRDFGSFQIFKLGNLAIHRQIAKGFVGGNIQETKQNMFYNTIGVLKPQEGIGYNLMGYRSGYNDNARYATDSAFAEGGANHVGTVLADDLERTNYDYINYDYTNSWNYTQRVDYAQREFVYLRPSGGVNDEYVVVFDRIHALDPAYTKYWLLHSSFEPKLLDNNSNEITMETEDYPNDKDGIGGGRWVNKNSTSIENNIIDITNIWNGSHGRLYNKTLLPESFQINKVGGPEHYWEDAEGRIIWPKPGASKTTLTDKEMNFVGSYTMQIQSTTNQTYDNFLNVIQFGDSNTLTQMNPASRIDADMMVGAFIGDPHSPRVVMFSQDQKGASVQSVRYKVNYFAALTGKHLLADMEPGKYDVYKNGVKIHSDLSALDKKGTLYFEANGDSSQEESKESVFQVVRTGEIPAPITITGDINGDNKVDVLDLQLCVNVVLGIEAREEIVSKAKQVTAPLEECDVLDIQAVVNVILNSG